MNKKRIRCFATIECRYDSVSYGGSFDGIVGIIFGMEVAKLIIENNIYPEYSLEVIGTNDEECARFSSGFFLAKPMIDELKST
ncbi:hypothetical protein [Clostridium butyricum]|uniref:hypothetical protein n=1 Tax=Clostridium butyricum TaxID=1492 RepID=UPI0032BFFA33